MATPAWAGEEQTTWRSGDSLVYRPACHDPDVMTVVAEAPTDLSLWQRLVAGGACFVLPRPAPARLNAWVAGPFAMPGGWRRLDLADHGPLGRCRIHPVAGYGWTARHRRFRCGMTDGDARETMSPGEALRRRPRRQGRFRDGPIERGRLAGDGNAGRHLDRHRPAPFWRGTCCRRDGFMSALRSGGAPAPAHVGATPSSSMRWCRRVWPTGKSVLTECMRQRLFQSRMSPTRQAC